VIHVTDKAGAVLRDLLAREDAAGKAVRILVDDYT
jgi:Fe-S cluster assembly iron-binding protein IscA